MIDIRGLEYTQTHTHTPTSRDDILMHKGGCISLNPGDNEGKLCNVGCKGYLQRRKLWKPCMVEIIYQEKENKDFMM